jgi:Family of unknown function (DUF5681)
MPRGRPGGNPDALIPWKKGQSGNPGGRPKAIREVTELARQQTPLALAALTRIATSGKSESACVAAATALLDRGWGKPAQTIEATVHQQDDPAQLTYEQLLAIVQGRQPQLEAPLIEHVVDDEGDGER